MDGGAWGADTGNTGWGAGPADNPGVSEGPVNSGAAPPPPPPPGPSEGGAPVPPLTIDTWGAPAASAMSRSATPQPLKPVTESTETEKKWPGHWPFLLGCAVVTFLLILCVAFAGRAAMDDRPAFELINNDDATRQAALTRHGVRVCLLADDAAATTGRGAELRCPAGGGKCFRDWSACPLTPLVDALCPKQRGRFAPLERLHRAIAAVWAVHLVLMAASFYFEMNNWRPKHTSVPLRLLAVLLAVAVVPLSAVGVDGLRRTTAVTCAPSGGGAYPADSPLRRFLPQPSGATLPGSSSLEGLGFARGPAGSYLATVFSLVVAPFAACCAAAWLLVAMQRHWKEETLLLEAERAVNEDAFFAPGGPAAPGSARGPPAPAPWSNAGAPPLPPPPPPLPPPPGPPQPGHSAAPVGMPPLESEAYPAPEDGDAEAARAEKKARRAEKKARRAAERGVADEGAPADPIRPEVL